MYFLYIQLKNMQFLKKLIPIQFFIIYFFFLLILFILNCIKSLLNTFLIFF